MKLVADIAMVLFFGFSLYLIHGAAIEQKSYWRFFGYFIGEMAALFLTSLYGVSVLVDIFGAV